VLGGMSTPLNRAWNGLPSSSVLFTTGLAKRKRISMQRMREQMSEMSAQHCQAGYLQGQGLS
jgi:hypothetical protein